MSAHPRRSARTSVRPHSGALSSSRCQPARSHWPHRRARVGGPVLAVEGRRGPELRACGKEGGREATSGRPPGEQASEQAAAPPVASMCTTAPAAACAVWAVHHAARAPALAGGARANACRVGRPVSAAPQAPRQHAPCPSSGAQRAGRVPGQGGSPSAPPRPPLPPAPPKTCLGGVHVGAVLHVQPRERQGSTESEGGRGGDGQCTGSSGSRLRT